MDGVNELNKAFASPQCRLATFEITYCTYDLVRLLAIRFPSSLSEIKLNGYWFQKSLPRHAFDEWRWPRRLKSLSISDSMASPYTMAALLEHLPMSLTSLDLYGCKIGDAGLTLIVQALPPHLTSLNIGFTGMTGGGFEAVSSFLPLGLRSLNISANELGDAPGVLELNWKLPTSLTELNFDYSIETPRAMRALIRALQGNCSNLRSLYVSYYHYESSQHKLASILPPELNKLHLCRSMIGPAELDHYLSRCTSLESLNLYRNPCLGYAGMCALATRMPPRLVELDLSRLDLTDEMLVDVIPALPATLREFSLSENGVTDATAFLLAKHLPRSLAKFDMVDTWILGPGYEALHRAGSRKSRGVQLVIREADEFDESDDDEEGWEDEE
ncbi:hypothetical protein H9P43_004810 [Blastocladiella emersonii ATCC 22665]|nr:hypothetical protein H9P43_004810 [Blastocladiella emersonii ATCC 22665]